MKKKMCNEVKCEYKDCCTSYPDWCQTCVNNKGKRNHYKPDPCPQPYWPYPYIWPWYPQPQIWYTSTTGNSPQKQNYYTATG